MIDRIKKIMEKGGMNPSTFADFIGVNRATMNQTLKRNNNVSVNVLLPVLEKYPEINPDWLLLGKEPMYKDEKTILVHPTNPKEPDLFAGYSANPVKNTPAKEYQKDSIDKEVEKTPKQSITQPVMPELSLSENIDKIIIFFKNKTFVTLRPEE